jgi:hypothetical protein|tara:strand:- start:2625 stop:2759 length:135 start_codon:yes stop_codon:yes gene_type:complete
MKNGLIYFILIKGLRVLFEYYNLKKLELKMSSNLLDRAPGAVEQ